MKSRAGLFPCERNSFGGKKPDLDFYFRFRRQQLLEIPFTQKMSKGN